MAGNGSFSLLVNSYPDGFDQTARKIILEGQLVPIVATTGTFQAITSFSITSNVVTFVVANSYTGAGGDVVWVAGFVGQYAYLNGKYTTTAATSAHFTAALTHADVSTTTVQGVSTIACTYQTGGLAINDGFVDNQGNVVTIHGISGSNYPNGFPGPDWIEFKTALGNTEKYEINRTVNPPLVLAYTGITQQTDATTLASDMITFRAEYLKGY